MYKVLICDDDGAALDLLVKNVHWEKFNMQVAATASNGKLGLEAYSKQRMDLVILDIMMPAMNGMALAGEIRKKGPHTKIVFITSSDNLNDAIRAINLKADGYILKPFSVGEIEDILVKIRESLDSDSGEEQPQKVDGEQNADIVRKVNEYIKEHIGERIKLGDIADHLNYASAYLGQIYKANTGVYISDKILELKMKYAAELLDIPFNHVGDVADKLGYSDYTYFIKQFKEYYGVTPNVYKKGNL